LGLLGIGLRNLFWFAIYRVFWYHDSGREFCRLDVLPRISFFYHFLINYFSQLHPSTLGWLRIKLHNLFILFVFYGIIMVLWSESGVLRVSRVNLSFFPFINWFFFYFHPSTLIWLRIELYIFFYFLFMKLSWSLNPSLTSSPGLI
jgi:hypothetical protein